MSSHFESFCRVVDERIATHKGRKPRLNVYSVAIPEQESLMSVLTALSIEHSNLGEAKEETFLRLRMKTPEHLANVYLKRVNSLGWFLIAEGKKSPAEELLRRVAARRYRCIIRTYLASIEIRGLYESFCRSLNLVDSHVASFFATRRSEATLEGNILPRATLAVWQRNAERRFEDYENLGAYLTSLRFQGRGESEAYGGIITRDNRATLIEGRFSEFLQMLAMPALQIGLEHLRFFQNRERTVNRGVVKMKPFEYTLDSDLQDSHLPLLEKALHDVSNYALIYRGNPYFLASCYDRQDGSVYRVSAFGRRIVIVPLNEATEEALQRLFLSLSEHFKERPPTEYVRGEDKPWVPIQSQ